MTQHPKKVEMMERAEEVFRNVCLVATGFYPENAQLHKTNIECCKKMIETAFLRIHDEAVESCALEILKKWPTDKYPKCCKQAMNDNTISNSRVIRQLKGTQ